MNKPASALDLVQCLAQGLSAMDLQIDETTQQQMLAYRALLDKWNKTYNLTAIREPEQMVIRHLLDSLSAVPFIEGRRIIDVGTGAGLPGIPLALVFPDKQFVLIDSRGKKTRFIEQAISTLGINNVEVITGRVESYRPIQVCDMVISRAYASLGDMLKSTAHLCTPDGCFMTMKGDLGAAELDDIPSQFRVDGRHQVDVPGIPGTRQIVILRQNDVEISES